MGLFFAALQPRGLIVWGSGGIVDVGSALGLVGVECFLVGSDVVEVV